MMNSLPSLSITYKMYGWSKWGGGTMGLSKETLDEWACQVCGEMQVRLLPSYMFPMDVTQREYFRVCTGCKAKAIRKRLMFMPDLLRILRGII